MGEERKKVLRICSKIIFGVYLILMAYYLFFAESMGRTFQDRSYHYNLVLFREIKRFIIYRKTLGIDVVLFNLAGNVLAFVPFGMMLPILEKNFQSIFRVFLTTFELSLGIELIQLVFKVGSFDVDDLLLNTIGGVLGYGCFCVADRFRRGTYEKEKKKKL